MTVLVYLTLSNSDLISFDPVSSNRVIVRFRSTPNSNRLSLIGSSHFRSNPITSTPCHFPTLTNLTPLHSAHKLNQPTKRHTKKRTPRHPATMATITLAELRFLRTLTPPYSPPPSPSSPNFNPNPNTDSDSDYDPLASPPPENTTGTYLLSAPLSTFSLSNFES